MSLFPTQYSTLSAAALRPYIEQAYGFTGLTCRYLLRGVSDTYVLEGSAAKYILKIYREAHRSLNEIRGEVALLTLLCDNGARVAAPLADAAGEYVQHFAAAEGSRHGVLFAYAEGNSVYAMSDAQLRTVGREMARVHNCTAGLQLPYPRPIYNVATTLTGPLQVLEPSFQAYPEGLTYLRELAAAVERKLAEFDLGAFGYGYCQYDFLPKNFHFDAQDALTFFDFDFAGQGYLVNDVMSFFVHFFLDRYYKGVPPAEAERAFAVFLAGYREVRPLSEAELAAIPYLGVMFWIFYLGFAAENFDDWSNFFFTPRYIQERVALIKQWVEWYGVA
ncbi:phosphotransferase enzyme family protein [Hymenobacter profundi]|uniref:Phosphotransferase n=1 Tax=Hymenobacter profundi TaxID=1982110 RepID=A0ABS6X432_9BACT|nr:phosphotransferase [Hymenobacter profundi]MBW3130599.1 phosphotransferase [Hymenobacter profundi]